MNNRPWPTQTQITQVDTNAKTPTELSQVFATLNALVIQFNQLVTAQGNLRLQINAILNQLKGIFPYDGVRDAGYISNEVLKDWPNAHWTLGAGGTDFIDVTLTGTPSVAFSAAAGTFHVLAGSVSLDADALTGIQKEDIDLVLYASTTGGIVRTAAVFKPGGYQAADGTPGASTVDGETTLPTGDAVFKDGLFTTGSIIPDVPVDAAFYVRSNAGTEIVDGAWVSLATFFDGLVADTAWPGSADLVTLGTVTTGEWNGTEIGVAYGGTGLVELGDPGQVLAVNDTGDALEYVTLDVVAEAPDDSTPYVRYNATGETSGAWQALSTYFSGLTAGTDWPGSSSLVTLGTVATGVWHGTTIATGYGGTGLTSIGSALQVLRVNSAGTALEFADPADALPELGTANQILGVNAAASDVEYKTLAGTSNQITVTHSAGGVTLSTPQNIHTSAVPTFAGVTAAYAKPASDGTSAYTIKNAAGTANILRVDTTNGVVYPSRIVVPTI